MENTISFKEGDKVSFTPNKKADRTDAPTVGVITRVFTNKEGKNYCNIKTENKNFLKQIESVTLC